MFHKTSDSCASDVMMSNLALAINLALNDRIGNPSHHAIDASTRYRLSLLNERLTALERSLEFIEAKVNAGVGWWGACVCLDASIAAISS